MSFVLITFYESAINYNDIPAINTLFTKTIELMLLERDN